MAGLNVVLMLEKVFLFWLVCAFIGWVWGMWWGIVAAPVRHPRPKGGLLDDLSEYQPHDHRGDTRRMVQEVRPSGVDVRKGGAQRCGRTRESSAMSALQRFSLQTSGFCSVFASLGKRGRGWRSRPRYRTVMHMLCGPCVRGDLIPYQ